MSKIYKHYSEEEKLSLIRSYYQSGRQRKGSALPMTYVVSDY